jgi:hypothetical protein
MNGLGHSIDAHSLFFTLVEDGGRSDGMQAWFERSLLLGLWPVECSRCYAIVQYVIRMPEDYRAFVVSMQSNTHRMK